MVSTAFARNTAFVLGHISRLVRHPVDYTPGGDTWRASCFARNIRRALGGSWEAKLIELRPDKSSFTKSFMVGAKGRTNFLLKLSEKTGQKREQEVAFFMKALSGSRVIFEIKDKDGKEYGFSCGRYQDGWSSGLMEELIYSQNVEHAAAQTVEILGLATPEEKLKVSSEPAP